jgi:hypothetical protein
MSEVTSTEPTACSAISQMPPRTDLPIVKINRGKAQLSNVMTGLEQ